MSNYTYKRNLLVTSRSRLSSTNLYKVPMQSHFNSIALSQVYINNDFKNAINHFIEMKIEGSSSVYVQIPDGSYNGAEYATAVQTALQNKFFNGIGGNTTVKFEYIEDEKAFRLTLDNKTDKNIYWKPNLAFGSLTGFSDENRATSPAGKVLIINSDTTPSLIPRYYTIRSNTLSHFGYDYNGENNSSIICTVPIDYSKNYTVWENPDKHMITSHNDTFQLNQNIQIEICLEDNHYGIDDPNFSIVFSTCLF